MNDHKKHKPTTTVIFEDPSPISSRVVNPHDSEFVEGYEKEETKQACLEAFEKNPPRDPKDRTQSRPYLWLRDAHMLLIADDEYRARYERTGDSPREDAFDDPAAPPEPIDVIEDFRYSVHNGLMPNPNALIFVANCIAAYLESKGKISLDEAFGMKSKQRVGNPAQHREKQSQDDEFLSRMSQYRADNPSATIEDAARACHEGPWNADAETYCETMAKLYSKNGLTAMEKSMEGGRIKLDSDLKDYSGK